MAVLIFPRHVVAFVSTFIRYSAFWFYKRAIFVIRQNPVNLPKKSVSRSLLNFWRLLKEEALWCKMRFSLRTLILRDWRNNIPGSVLKFRSQRLARVPKHSSATPTAYFPMCVEIANGMLFVWLLILCLAYVLRTFKCRGGTVDG
jgi:hypothetical protein